MSQLRYECPAKLEYIAIIDEFLEAMLQREGLQDCAKFCFAAHELVINSIEAMKKTNKNIVIQISLEETEVLFSVTDWGSGVPQDILEKVNSIDGKEISMDENGRGLFLVQQFVDKFSIKEENSRFTYSIMKNR